MQAHSFTMATSARRQMAVAMAVVLILGSLSIAVQAESESAERDRPLTRDQIEFMENNWHLNSGTVMWETMSPDASARIPGDVENMRNMVEFRNANWHFDTGALMVEQ